MKLVYVVTRGDAVGGASIHVRDLARAMLDRGHDALVLLGGPGPVADLLSAAGIPYRALEFLRRPIHPVQDLRAFHEIVSALGELRPDLVSVHTAKAGWIGRAACAHLGLPAIYTPHGLPVGRRMPPASAAVFTVAEHVAAGWGYPVICVSEAERKLCAMAGLAGGVVHVVHNGVRDIPVELRARAAVSPVRICSVARLEAPKDHSTLLLALARLRSIPWQLDLVGDGPLEGSIRALAESQGIADRVHFLGYRPDPARALAESQLFVLASRSEAFPRSLLEAMRAGLPAIASDVGGIREALDHEVTGLLVPPSDRHALAAAIAKLAESPAHRASMAAAARQAYESCFRLDCMVERTHSLYQAVLK